MTPLPVTVSARYPLRYAVVDVETTGLHPAGDRVLQVAVAQMEADGAPGRSWSTLIDPGCDPGPVHIHGITRERLAGAPRFDMIAGHLAGLLEGRVLVAHNAVFDWRFLAAEAHRAVHPLPVGNRLCTLALSRRLDLPTRSLSLASLATHWGVPQARPHDAEDDTRVLVEILRHSLAAADALAVELPLSPCDPDDTEPVYPARLPRPACPWAWPGRWTPGRRLVQGAKIAITGSTATARDALAASATGAGLDVMNTVSGRTGLLVTNHPGAATMKLRAAAMYAVPVVDEATFTALLADVGPGTPKSAEPPRPAAPSPQPVTAGPLAGRCLLVLGGAHDAAAGVRARIGGLGGIAAVDLTTRVTGVVALPGAGTDRRWATVTALGLPVHTQDTLELPGPAPAAAPGAVLTAAPGAVLTAGPGAVLTAGPGAVLTAGPGAVLTAGAEIAVPEGAGKWTLCVAWPAGTGAEADVVAFLTDEDEQVRADADIVHRHQPAAADGCVELTLDVPHEALVDVRLGRVPADVSRIVVAATLAGGRTFADLGPVEFVARTAAGATLARATLDAAATGRALLLAHFDRRGDGWHLRAVGRSHDHGLAALAARYGAILDD